MPRSRIGLTLAAISSSRSPAVSAFEGRDRKLRGCDLVGLHVYDVVHGTRVASRTMVMQKKTQRPVQFEITEQTQETVTAWIETAQLKNEQFLFPSRIAESPHLSTRQYSR